MAEVKFLVHGSVNATTGRSSELSLPKDVSVTTKYDVSVQAARAGDVPNNITARDDDVVEIEFADGVKLWSSVEQLRQDQAKAGARSANTNGTVLPHQLQFSSQSRGPAAWVIKGLKILGVDIASGITDFISSKVENQLGMEPGLYRCSVDGKNRLIKPGTLRPNRPSLVFLHGTASSTDGSFGNLWDGDERSRMTRLIEAYDGQVLALQHRTLTLSPIENACDLVTNLPTGARLHLVSHSRGGLIGELICRAMREGRTLVDDLDFKQFADLDRQRDVAALRELAEVMEKKQLKVERFVRVACPARGTTLADGRLDRYLSVLVNVLSFAGLKSSPIFDAISTLLVGVVKKRTDPKELPGLEAMMPGSPLVTILNRADIRVDADLHVLGGDIAGAGVLGTLKTLVTDLFYREDHDLVVNTPSMFGGAERTRPVRYWIDEGSDVNHFHYFRRDATADRLMAALLESENASFHIVEKKPAAIAAGDYRKRAVGPQPVVFVIPGIMGSQLTVKKNPVWVDYGSLALGGMGRLVFKENQQDVAPGLPLESGYGGLIRFLAQTHEVVPFGYDWRRSLVDEAERLRKALAAKLEETRAAPQPIRIIAHSMGGLVVRAMMATLEGAKVWEQMRQRQGSRLIMLGTPNGGSHSIAAMLMGRDPLVRKLAMLDLQHNYAQLLQIICGFPGVMHLLPDAGKIPLFKREEWERLRRFDVESTRGLFASSVAGNKSSDVSWCLPAAELLEAASDLRQQMKKVVFDPSDVIYVAGAAPATPVDVWIDEQAPPGRRVVVEATEYGDGRVPWDTGIPSELKNNAYYMDAVHGDMAAHDDAFSALFDLLTAGTTTKLAKSPPGRRSSAGARFVLPPQMPVMHPDEADLEASALGGTVRQQRRHVQPKVRVRVIHSHLSSARSPVVVGHYCGDAIVSAEGYLDHCLHGRLSERLRLGLYPGDLGTAEVFIQRAESGAAGGHPGAVVIGLGQVGDLTPGKLAAGVARGAVMYGAERLEQARGRKAAEGMDILPTPLTTLLVATGAGGFSVADCLQAMLRGIRMANQRLEQADGSKPGTTQAADSDGSNSDVARTQPRTAWISELTIIELYEDRAIQATRALQEVARSSEFRPFFEIEELMQEGEGGRRRASFQEDPAWWRRVRIEAQVDGSLKFEIFSDRARAETSLRATQRHLVERFLKDAAASTATDPDLCVTLFEMLVPNNIKEMAPDRRNVVLVLDEAAAAYPWELMQNRFDAGSGPLAVEAGMVRQLTVDVFRENAAMVSKHTALVVGDPKNSDPRFPALPGAQAEARQVVTQLNAAKYAVVDLIGDAATPRSVLTQLHARPYRLLHLAAHGVFEFETEPPGEASPGEARTKTKVTGMALGDGAFLTPAEFEQMRDVPDFVFINCCHLGKTGADAHAGSYHRLAANVATQLIRMGVRAVIAAGWAVDDDAAETFAQVFYREFLAGRPFGDAVREARQEIYNKHRQANTWGAYQCYGEHGFRLARGAEDAQAAPTPVASAELRTYLGNIAAAMPTDSKARTRLDDVLKAAPPAWMRLSSTQSALGAVYAEARDYEEAIKHLAEAAALHPAKAPVEAVEQLANFRARLGESIGQKEPGRSRSLFAQAEKGLKALLSLGETPERLALLGSLEKRRAMVAKPAAICGLLAKAASFYHRAYKNASNSDSLNYDPEYRYGLQNWIATEVVASWGSGLTAGKKAEIEKGLLELDRIAAKLSREAPDVWAMLLPADTALLRAVYERKLDPEAIAALFREAALRAGSPRQIDSVLTQLKFFRTAADKIAETKPKAKTAGVPKPLMTAMADLATRLESLVKT